MIKTLMRRLKADRAESAGEYELEFNRSYQALFYPMEEEIIARIAENCGKLGHEPKALQEVVRRALNLLRMNAINAYVNLRKAGSDEMTAYSEAARSIDSLLDAAVENRIVKHPIYEYIDRVLEKTA